jgi:hypothetical protein
MSFRALLVLLVLPFLVIARLGLASNNAPAGKERTDAHQTPGSAFPSISEVLQGRTFGSKFERDVFFLKEVRQKYPAFWTPLLEANITLNDYAWNPSKLRLFLEELGSAVEDSNDIAACTNVVRIISDPAFYAHTNAYRAELTESAARTLIKVGREGKRALTGAFTQEHYRIDPGSLVDLATVIGSERVADQDLAKALEAAAFRFSTVDGGSYPRCTEAFVKTLLTSPTGEGLVRINLKPEGVLADPGRFQAVVDGVGAAHASGLATNLEVIRDRLAVRLAALTNSPGAYRDDLGDLQMRLQQTITNLRGQPAKVPM